MTVRRIGKMVMSCSLVIILGFSAGLTLAKKPPRPSGAMPHNIILMISDGQGYNAVAATEYFTDVFPVYEGFPEIYGVNTYPFGGSYNSVQAWNDFDYVKSGATDSAAAATAMATGVKTRNGYLGVDSSGPTVKNLVEAASAAGKATGVVTSVEFSHATPAGMAAHTTNRSDYAGIAIQMLSSELDVIMGAGHPEFNDNGVAISPTDYKYVGGAETWNALLDPADGQYDDWTLIEEEGDFENLAAGSYFPTSAKLLGVAQVHTTLQQNRTGSTPNDNVPELETMSLGALNLLSEDPDGFSLMVEGGAVDWASHDNNLVCMLEEERDFNAAVQAVVDWVEANSSWQDTLLIVTADHETGHLWGPTQGMFNEVVDNGPGDLPGAAYNSSGHTHALVPLYARGKGAELFAGYADQNDTERGPYVDNTEIFAVMTGKAARVKPGKGGKGRNKSSTTSFKEAVGF